MSRTAFCDSFDTRRLLIANDRAGENLAQLRVVVATANVLRVLRLTGVDQVLDIYPSLPKALADSAPVVPRSSGSKLAQHAPVIEARQARFY
jgi:anti-anti-sigma regulatory factor